MQSAAYVSGVGCNATASIMALLPLQRAGLLDLSKPIIVDVKVGSSEAGASPNAGTHHPERSGVIRTYAPTGHRHTAEVLADALGERLAPRAVGRYHYATQVTSGPPTVTREMLSE